MCSKPYILILQKSNSLYLPTTGFSPLSPAIMNISPREILENLLCGFQSNRNYQSRLRDLWKEG